ncbi:MAG TPA: ABC transporter ATP-binding protein [Hyphomicrobiaceae bacterium]|jgi:molybdate transport system ATP-binding protein|nr:ABC transporter ATP-binding protein [Hyphomicrobiaceae bacterium]
MQCISVELAQEAPIPLDARFQCASGELLALVGPSGSGKSTILRTIAGLYRPERGRVAVDGEVWLDRACGIDVPTHRRGVGMVFQSYALFPHMTALDNVRAALNHIDPATRDDKARSLLALVHLSGLEGRRPAELSGGQQQRVALARALAREPKALLLDEPFSAVDQMTRERLKVELVTLRALLKMPIVLVTHDLDEALALADRICVLYRGRSLQTGAPDDLRLRPRSPTVARLVGQTNIFHGTLYARAALGQPGRLDWSGGSLEVAETGDWPTGSRVAWMVAADHIVLHRRGRPSLGERENPVAGIVADLAVLGEQTAVTVHAADRSDAVLNFRLPTHAARRNELSKGAEVTVSLLAKGIHLMPPETSG